MHTPSSELRRIANIARQQPSHNYERAEQEEDGRDRRHRERQHKHRCWRRVQLALEIGHRATRLLRSRPAQFLRGERIFRAMESSSDSGERSAPKQIVEADRIEGRKISHIQFGMFSPDEVAKLAEFEAVSSDFRDSKNMAPAKSGVLDRRLGVSDKSSKCETCGMGLQDCPGHFGRIKLELPVFHVGYFKPLVAVLQCICKTCSRVLLPLDKRPRFLKQMNHPMTQNDHVRRAAVFRKVLEACKKEKVCPHCAAINGVVKKVGCMRIIHERLRERAAATKQRAGSEHYEKARSEFRESFEEAEKVPKGGFFKTSR